MPIQIYNTLSRHNEPLETIEPRAGKDVCLRRHRLRYRAHRPRDVGDCLRCGARRYLQYRGYRVDHIVNFTDVDDKIINRANALGRNPKELSRKLCPRIP